MATNLNVWSWSATAADNATADASISWPEGQDPATVNDSARGMMAAIAKMTDVQSGNVTVGGTADAITITTGQSISSGHQALGFRICFQAAATNTGAATVAVDGMSAVAIKRPNGDALAAGDIVSGGFFDIAFDGTNYKLLAAGAAAGTYGTLAGSNTWTGSNLFQGTPTTIGNDVADVVTIKGTTVHSAMSALMSSSSVAALRTAMGLGTAAISNIGTSGNVAPFLSGANTWSNVQNIISVQSGGGVLGLQAVNAASGQPVMSFSEPSPTRVTGSVTYVGIAGAFGVAYNTTSDGRLKQDRRPLDDSGAIIDALQPLYYRWLGQGDEDFGFVAQDLAAIPQLARNIIRGDDDPDKRPGNPGYVGWQTEKAALVPILVAEIKALRARVAALEAG